MIQDYIIINKAHIQKRIANLEKVNEQFRLHAKTHNPTMAACEAILSTLKEIISQSIPLIPEIEEAFDAGSERCEFGYGNANDKHDYIKNLKLDI